MVVTLDAYSPIPHQIVVYLFSDLEYFDKVYLSIYHSPRNVKSLMSLLRGDSLEYVHLYPGMTVVIHLATGSL